MLEKINTILKINVPPDSILFLLGVIPKERFGVDQRHNLYIFLLIAKKMITVNWKNIKPPTITQWSQKLRQIYIREQVAANLQLRMELFVHRWKCAAVYLGLQISRKFSFLLN